MNFNSKILDPIVKKGALKSYNQEGVKLAVSSKSDGHTFGGSLDADGSGKMSYKGNWYGMDLSKELSSNGARTVTFGKTKEVMHQNMDFKLQWKTGEAGKFGGDVNLSVSNSFKKCIKDKCHNFSAKTTVKTSVYKEEGEAFKFNGIETELAYNNDDKTFGLFGKFGAFAKGGKEGLKVKQLGQWQKRGIHTWAVDARFCDDGCDAMAGLTSVNFYG